MKYHECGRRILRVWEVKRLSLVLFMLGFFVGIIYVNVFARNYMISVGIFSDYFLEQYSKHVIRIDEYFLRVIQIRIFPITVLGILAGTNYKKLAGSIYILWTGLLFGMLLTTAVLKLGIKGVVLCLIGVLPHYICYVSAYAMILIYMITYPDVRWNSSKTISMIIFMMLGIITECYINPVLMDIFMKTL